jgi:methylated-DNA-protein-cysteine methyltransferase-like protein
VDERLLERVLIVVELIPPGRVASYGDVGRLAGTSPRHVGNIMRDHGQGVPWWRVTNADGELPAHLDQAAREHWAEEGISPKPIGRGCLIQDCRADLADLEHAFHRVWSTISPD